MTTNLFSKDYNQEGDEAFFRLLESGKESEKRTESKFDPTGEWNHLSTTIRDGKFLSKSSDMLLINHEKAHSMIGSETIYGILLSVYASLANHSKKNQSDYQRILKEIDRRSRNTHEIFATWFSLSRFLYVPELSYTLEELTRQDRDYISYYRRAESFLQSIPGFYNKQSVLIACVTCCFSSANLGKVIANPFEDFEPEGLDPLDGPDHRFQLIFDKFKGELLKTTLDDLVSANSVRQEYELTRREIAGEFILDPDDSTGYFTALDEIRRSFFELFRNYLNQLDSPSLDLKDSGDCFKAVKAKVNAELGFCMFFLEKEKENMRERSIIGFLENNNLLLNDRPEKAHILFSHELDPELQAKIFTRENQQNIWAKDWYFVVVMRTVESLIGQYDFIDKEKEEWLKNQKGLIVYLNTRIVEDGKLTVLIIPFQEPYRAFDFFSNRTIEFPVCATIFYHAWDLVNEQSKWKAFIDVVCEHTFYFNDLSLIYLLDENFYYEAPGEITCCSEEFKVNADTKCRVVVAKVTNPAASRPIYVLTPGNVGYCHQLSRYQEKIWPGTKHQPKKEMLMHDELGTMICEVLKQIYLEHRLDNKYYLTYINNEI